MQVMANQTLTDCLFSSYSLYCEIRAIQDSVCMVSQGIEDALFSLLATDYLPHRFNLGARMGGGGRLTFQFLRFKISSLKMQQLYLILSIPMSYSKEFLVFITDTEYKLPKLIYPGKGHSHCLHKCSMLRKAGCIYSHFKLISRKISVLSWRRTEDSY